MTADFANGPSLIFKIVPRALWQAAKARGVFDGAPVDLADGFIHFSTGAQVEETAAKRFRGQHDLLLVTVDPAKLGPDLRWEVSRGGQRFPHLYAPLGLVDVSWVKAIPLQSDGGHDFSELLA